MQKLLNIKSRQEFTADVKTAGLKAFFNIMELWQIKPQDAMILLGQPARSTFFKWKKEKSGDVPYDSMIRISYILGIYKTLQILFTENNRADNWLHKPNAAFGGQSALERMLGGNVTDIAYIRDYLDSIKGGGWS